MILCSSSLMLEGSQGTAEVRGNMRVVAERNSEDVFIVGCTGGYSSETVSSGGRWTSSSDD